MVLESSILYTLFTNPCHILLLKSSEVSAVIGPDNICNRGKLGVLHNTSIISENGLTPYYDVE